MTLLHVYFALRKQQSFHRLLNGGPGQPPISASTSSGKSWKRAGVLNSGIALEINALDTLGRSVLHLACTSTEASSLEYVRMLLAHPAINVNVLDKESHWTPLHRALYAGNISAAILLLKRLDIDTSIKDLEGYTAHDLYNSTVRSAKPTEEEETFAELFTWGTNRNAALGLGDGNDRAYPDRVVIPRKDDVAHQHNRSLDDRFAPIHVRQVSMSKLHTVVLTSEPRDNIRVCGFGGGGRLGPSQHTQHALIPLPDIKHTIESVALGQDHTLALTSAGEVLTWGLNRFSQLGYVIEVSSSNKQDEHIQATPRKVGSLRREFVKGVAACKTASGCWTDTEVWTWGTNGGQLGYDKALVPIQVLPRKVSSIVQPVRAIVMTETLMACLFLTGEVVCVWSGGVSKISFPTQRFSSEISVYRPPQAIKGQNITKLRSCDDTIAALSSNGEVFTFTSQPIGESDSAKSSPALKPQRIWALRRQFSAVQDVDIGVDGTVIVCTQSGHVYVRSRSAKGGQGSGAKAFKFQRIPYIQRAVAVCANSTGAFGALRVDFKPSPIHINAHSFSCNITEIQPYLGLSLRAEAPSAILNTKTPLLDADEDGEDVSIIDDIGDLSKLLHVLDQCKNVPDIALPYNADVVVVAPGPLHLPAHRLILAVRCPVLGNILHSGRSLYDKSSGIDVSLVSGDRVRIRINGCHPFTVLILLRYLYSDQLLAIWDLRVGSPFVSQFETFAVKPVAIKAELQSLSRILGLQLLLKALQSPGKRVPTPSQTEDFRLLYERSQLTGRLRNTTKEDALAPDVALHLADQVIVWCHSVVLHARCQFFASFFEDSTWTSKRRDKSGIINIDFKHLEWQVMQYVVRWICYGDENLFESLDFVQGVDDVLSFMFSVLSAANELLLDRLMLLCSQVILKHLDVYNACYLLTDATHINATHLVERLQSYVTANLEMMLEGRMLEDLDPSVVRQLSEYIRSAQMTKSPVSRSNLLANKALRKHAEWLAQQDIPVVFEPVDRPQVLKDSSKSLTPGLLRTRPISSLSVHPAADSRKGADAEPSGDELFAMDEVSSSVITPGHPVPVVTEPSGSVAVWKRPTFAPRTDLKAIMAEAENTKISGVANRATHSAMDKPSQEHLKQVATPQRRTVGSSLKLDASPTPRQMPSDLDLGKSSLPESSAAAAQPMHVRTPQRPATQAIPLSSKTRPNTPSLGPVFSPVRQVPPTSSSPGPRRVSNTGAAWTLPPVQPVVQSSVAESSPLSFAEIQQLQLLQGIPAPKDKRSLVEIQEEERAIQLEADFMKWWAAEEARTQAEAHGASETQTQRATPRSKNRGGKRPSHSTRSKPGEARPAQGSSRPEGGKQSMTPAAEGAMLQSGVSNPKSRRRRESARPTVDDSIHVQPSKGR
ncbi:uncharacterized protein BJ212DRAFT_190743 [Suillus subaureus]|uniref:BTB domain-containing protein n=1 Tax=Suillus subaureus TaxID=48587 RepID=A0A9P7EAY2_9AGAM|nr:uncharacterized protein BJ212DRAFT_190743 [Suillus subaureus]KAG1816404.1 hypothetical protein BJ212DRAFT_190743 [Suillus subaureus]